MIGLEGQWERSGLVLQSSKDVVLGNLGSDHTKLTAVLNSFLEETPDVSNSRMAERAERTLCDSFCFLESIRHFVFRIMRPLLPLSSARHGSSLNSVLQRKRWLLG